MTINAQYNFIFTSSDPHSPNVFIVNSAWNFYFYVSLNIFSCVNSIFVVHYSTSSWFLDVSTLFFLFSFWTMFHVKCNLPLGPLIISFLHGNDLCDLNLPILLYIILFISLCLSLSSFSHHNSLIHEFSRFFLKTLDLIICFLNIFFMSGDKAIYLHHGV